MNRSERQLTEYIALFIGLVAFFILLMVFRYENLALKIIALMGSLFYIVWGVFHHAADKRLTKPIMMEYLFLGSMVYLLFYLVLSV